MIYWVLLAFFLYMTVLYKRRIIVKYGTVKQTIDGYTYAVLSGFVLIMVAGLRSTCVSRDTSMYHTLFVYMTQMETLSEALSSGWRGGVEVGYAVLEYCFAKNSSFQVFLFAAAIISIAPVVFVMYKYSSDCWMSLFLYIAFGFFSFSMNGLRQAIAIGICMLAYIAAQEKKLFQFLLSVLLATLFHLSAVVFFPVYWFSRIKINNLIIAGYVCLLALVSLFKEQIFIFLNLFSRQSYEASVGAGGSGMFLFMVFTLVLLLVYQKQLNQDVKKDENNNTLTIMVAFAILVWPIASMHPTVMRFCSYYQIFMIFAIPNLLSHMKGQKIRWVCSVVFLIVGCYFLQNYIIEGELLYSPYYFFWQ